MSRVRAVLVAVVGAVALLLAGCGGPDGPSGPTRTVAHAMGSTEVPVEPKVGTCQFTPPASRLSMKIMRPFNGIASMRVLSMV